MHSPVEQFTIKKIFDFYFLGIDLSFTNSSLFMLLSVLISFVFLFYATKNQKIIPSRMQCAAEMLYEFIANMIRDNVGKEGKPYFSLIFTLFLFILTSNLLGLIPYSYTTTSQIIVTFVIAASIFTAVTILALLKHGLHFFTIFESTMCVSSSIISKS